MTAFADEHDDRGPAPWVAMRLWRLAGLAGLCMLLAACGSLPRNAVPPQRELVASIPGLPDIRAWGGPPSAILERDLALSFQQESETDFPRNADGTVRYAHLALSGGGANGAFGAGFLNGWTATGRVPTFKIVTGVSTGALMAPFAFLGPRLRRRAAPVLHHHKHTRHLHARLAAVAAAGWRGIGRHAAAADADRPARRCRTAAPRGRSTPARAAAVHRHRRPRRAALRRLEHGADRQQRPPRCTGSVPQGDAGVGIDPGGLSAGVVRRRAHARRATLRRDACRRWRRRTRVPERRRVPRFGHPRTRRPGRQGARGHLRHPQRPAGTDPRTRSTARWPRSRCA